MVHHMGIISTDDHDEGTAADASADSQQQQQQSSLYTLKNVMSKVAWLVPLLFLKSLADVCVSSVEPTVEVAFFTPPAIWTATDGCRESAIAPLPLPAECVSAQNTVETLVSALAGAGALIGFFVTPLLGRASGTTLQRQANDRLGRCEYLNTIHVDPTRTNKFSSSCRNNVV
jgi:hypothetical protein